LVPNSPLRQLGQHVALHLTGMNSNSVSLDIASLSSTPYELQARPQMMFLSRKRNTMSVQFHARACARRALLSVLANHAKPISNSIDSIGTERA
jgi:hypothetical protein